MQSNSIYDLGGGFIKASLAREDTNHLSKKENFFFFRVSKNSRGIVDGRRPITVCGGGGNLLMGKGKSQKKTQQIPGLVATGQLNLATRLST